MTAGLLATQLLYVSIMEPLDYLKHLQYAETTSAISRKFPLIDVQFRGDRP